MKHVAWIQKKTNVVYDISTYGEGVSYAESDNSYAIEVQEGSIPEIGMVYNGYKETFSHPLPKREREKKIDA